MPSGFPFSAADRGRFVGLVCTGLSLEAAARVVGVSRTAAWRWWRHVTTMKLIRGGQGDTHGVAMGSPMRPGGRGHRLSRFERGAIELGLGMALTITAIARLIGRDKSVVCRELRRNRGDDGVYYAGLAEAKAYRNARRPKVFKLVDNSLLCWAIEEWMEDGWSPGVIAAVLRNDFRDDPAMRVSHETIYRYLYVQTRGELRKDLFQQLSTKRRQRKPVGRADQRRQTFAEAYKISDRPAEVADRAVPGHWEGDLIVGTASQSAIGTLVERTTRFTLLLHLPGDHTADTVATAMIAAMKDLPEHLRRSITWDRGREIAAYHRIQLEIGAPVYLCDPHSPWQRGTNENTNRLLRHWFTKGTDLSSWTAGDLKIIQDKLNQRPRPTLDLQTPAQALNQLLLHAA